MAQKLINVPGIGQVAFPDDMSDDDIAGVIQKQHPDLAPAGPPPDARSWWQVAKDGYLAANQGVTSLIGGIPNAINDAGWGVWNSLTGQRVQTPSGAVPTIGGLAKGTGQAMTSPITTSARGLGALVAPNKVNAPTDQEWQNAQTNAGGNLAGLTMGPIAEAGIPKILPKVAKPPIPPHVAVAGKLDSIVNEISDPALHQAVKNVELQPTVGAGARTSLPTMGSMIEGAVKDASDTTHQVADAMQQPARDAVASASEPTRRATKVSTEFTGTQSHDLIDTPIRTIKMSDGSTIKGTLPSVKVPGGEGSLETGDVNVKEDPPRIPDFLNDNIPAVTSPAAGEALQAALEKQGPVGPIGSQATATNKLGTGPAREDFMRTLRRVAPEHVDAFQTGEAMHASAENDTTSQLINTWLQKNPDTAYRGLLQPNLSEAQLSKVKTMLGPDLTGKMTGQLLRDLFAKTVNNELTVNPTATSVASGSNTLLKALTEPQQDGLVLGDRLRSLMGDAAYEKLEDTARSGAAKQVPATKWMNHLSSALKFIPGMGGIGHGIDLTSKIMSSNEGGSYVRGLVRSLGNMDEKRTGFYTGRLQDITKRQFQPSTEEAKPVEKAGPPPPPPG